MLFDRLRLLTIGSPGSGKSQGILDIARELPGVKVYVFDMQDSIAPLFGSSGKPENMELYRIGGESVEAWDEFRWRCKEVRKLAKPGDWVCFDIAGDFWELAQRAYVERLYETTLEELKESKMAEALAEGKKGKKLGFGGLETDDWQVIKGQYYPTIPQTLGTSCKANVFVTAWEKSVASWMDKKTGEMKFQDVNLPGAFKEAGLKPDAEKGLAAGVDMVLRLEHPTKNKWVMSVMGKNRFGVEFTNLDFSGASLWGILRAEMGEDPERSPGQ